MPPRNDEAVRDLPQYDAVQSLERHLGSPHDVDNETSYRSAVLRDASQEFPQAALDVLQTWGFNQYAIPSRWGDRLGSYETVFGLSRVVARRDPALALAASVPVWSNMVWFAGTEAQQRQHAESLRSGRPACFACSEENHGADLLASDVTYEREAEGYRIRGSKWPINRAQQSGSVLLLAREQGRSGPRSLSVFLIEKDQLAADAWSLGSKEQTHGMRSCDLRSLNFHHAWVPSSALLGKSGRGLEVALYGLQISRLLCLSLGMGAVDTALRATLHFARNRRLYRDSVWAIPAARRALVESWLDLLIADVLCTTWLRGIHVVPRQLSLGSAIVKSAVPELLESALARLATVMGARGYVQHGPFAGIFEKLRRDVAVIATFDGSTPINLQAIAAQLPSMRSASAPHAGELTPCMERMPARFDLGCPLPELDPSLLDIACHGEDDVVQSLDLALSQLDGSPAQTAVKQQIATGLRQILGSWESHKRHLATLISTADPSRMRSPEMFQIARGYIQLHTYASCLHMWQRNQDRLCEPLKGGEWLALALTRTGSQFVSWADEPLQTMQAAVERAVLGQADHSQLFALIPVALEEDQR